MKYIVFLDTTKLFRLLQVPSLVTMNLTFKQSKDEKLAKLCSMSPSLLQEAAS